MLLVDKINYQSWAKQDWDPYYDSYVTHKVIDADVRPMVVISPIPVEELQSEKVEETALLQASAAIAGGETTPYFENDHGLIFYITTFNDAVLIP